jgi:hypothetical protein
MAAQANWKSYKLQVPGEPLLKKISTALETLVTLLDVLKAILETVKVFLIDFGNPIKAIVQALIDLVTKLFKTLQRSGFYLYLDIPDPSKDPSFKRQVGGYRGFAQRFKSSLVDSKDPNRPQPISGFLTGGYVVLLVDVDGPVQLLTRIQVLLRLFGQEFLNPHYAAPSNVRVLPVGAKGDPILATSKIFTTPPTALAIEWSLPSTTPGHDPGFSGVTSQISTEFYPPKWLIEKSTTPPVQEVPDDQLGDNSLAGYVTTQIESNYIDPRNNNLPVKRKIKLKDEYGDPFVKMQEYIVVDASVNSLSFFLGQLGTFRYIDKNVEPDKAYFYRVRAFSGELAITGKTITFEKPSQNLNDGGKYFLRWPGKSTTNPPIVGRGSSILRGRIPKLPPNFDVIGILKAVYLTAFSLDFHLPANPGDKFNSQGLPLDDSTLASHIGMGSLTSQAGSLAAFSSVPILNLLSQATSLTTSSNPVTGNPLSMPWQRKAVRFQSSRLTIAITSAMLDAGGSFVEGFRGLMQGPLPKGTISISWPTPTDTLEKLVLAFTRVDQGHVSDGTAKAWKLAFANPQVRLNVLAVVNYLRTFTLGGSRPDWIQVSLLRDIIPWAGQFLYDIIAKIQALVDAFRGVVDEIKAFIDLLIRKIDTLEKFIKFLLSILDFIESLQIDFAVLFIPSVSGDVGDWIAAFDGAQNQPTSGPQGYAAGIALAYLAPDVADLVLALQLIF